MLRRVCFCTALGTLRNKRRKAHTDTAKRMGPTKAAHQVQEKKQFTRQLRANSGVQAAFLKAKRFALRAASCNRALSKWLGRGPRRNYKIDHDD